MNDVGPIGPTLRGENNTIAGPLLFIIGFTSSSIQFIFLREAVILGGGSETMTGSFLWLWLMISALGSVAGGISRVRSLRGMMLAFVSGLILSLFLYLSTTSVILKPGEIPSFNKILAIISLTIFPSSFLASFVFIRLTSVRQSRGNFQPGDSFSLETVGSVAAGFFTAIFLTAFIANYQTYFVIIIIALLAVITLLYPSGTLKIVSWSGGLVILVLIFVYKPDVLIRGLLLKEVQVESSVDTPFGNITTGMYGGERTVFYDHRPLFFPGDVVRAEEDIHYALAQRNENNRLLLISGGIQNHLSQIKKHNVSSVVYIEHDPGIINIENSSDIASDRPELKVVKSDPISYLKKNEDRFSAIIQLLPSPTTLSLNRYFTLEYFKDIKSHLYPEGVFMCAPLPYYKYTPESYRKSFSAVYNSLNEVFNEIVLIPGSQLYVIASDGPLSVEISRLIDKKGIVNEYVNSFYLDDEEIRRNGDIVLGQLDRSSGLNTSVRPVTTWFNNTLDLEMRGIKNITVIVIILLMIMPFFFVRRGGIMMFAASAGLSGYGMILIFILQVAIGSIYLLSSVVLSVLMAGLAAGSLKEIRYIRKPLLTLPCLLSIIYFVTGLFAHQLTRTNSRPLFVIISLALFSAGYLTGNIYRVLTLSSGRNIPGRIYASDLAGAALGYMVVSVMLVPLAGISSSSFILAVFILVSVALVSVIYKH